MSPRPRIDLSTKLTNEPQAGEMDEREFGLPARPVPAGQRTKRVEIIPLARILPDEFQARLLLPPALAARFFSFELDCFQVAREWLALARQDPGLNRRVSELVALGNSLGEDGQIKSLTGSWTAIGGKTVFLLETGERRFWGAVLQSVVQPPNSEPSIEAISVPAPNRIRQVIENEKSEAPTAVSRARAIAGLILHYHQIPPDPSQHNRYAYHRQALKLRVTLETWSELERIFGIQRPHLSQQLHLLEFPDPLLDLADLYNLPERKLREIRQLPSMRWEKAIWEAVHEVAPETPVPGGMLTAPEAKVRAPRRTEPTVKAARQLKGVLTRLENTRSEDAVGELADALFEEYASAPEVRSAAAQLEDLAAQLRARAAGG